MSNLRELEHDGTEFFDSAFPNRKVVSKQKVIYEKGIKEKAENDKNNLQKQWLDINNPALWDGEFE